MAETGQTRPPLMARMRNGMRAVLDRSFQYELAWAVGAVLVLTLLLSKPPLGVRYDNLVVGQPAPRDIIVPLTVEIPDEVRTAASREAARRQTPPAYVFNSSAASRADAMIADAFETGRRLMAQAPSPRSEAAAAFEASLRDTVLSQLPSGSGPEIVDIARKAGFSKELERDLRSAVQSILSRMIVLRRDGLPSDRPISVRKLEGGGREELLSDYASILDIDSARERVSQSAAAIESVPKPERPRIADFLRRFVSQTLTLDQVETTRRMDEAARRVPTLLARIERGTVLARRGTPLTEDIVEQARAVEAARPNSLEPAPLAGTGVLCALLIVFLWVYPRYQRRRTRVSETLFPMMALLLLVMMTTAWVMMWISSLLVERFEPPFDRLETLMYLVPVAAGGTLAALLFSLRIATVYTIFFSLPYAMLAGWDLRLLAFSLLTNFAAIYGAGHYRARTALMKAGGLVGVVGAATVLALDLTLGAWSGWQGVAADMGAALIGGAVGVSLLVSFLLPICESLFGRLTDVRLLELSNLNNPLLSRLAAASPGTYNHSLIVGTLAEAAAERISASGLYCRVAAAYHDIGKLKMPDYFIENQRARSNPHDRVAPSMSALIIANHVKEGIRMGREYGLPEQILDIIPQHHGTRVMTYFYQKAKAAAETTGAKVREVEFRYPGPKPQTREAAILMLADSVEAAARTIDEPDAEKFRGMIRQIAGRIVLDGQFDECDLTFRDLDTIVESFVRSLVAIYHHRLDYPTFVFEHEKSEKKAAARAERRAAEASFRRMPERKRQEASSEARPVPPGDGGDTPGEQH